MSADHDSPFEKTLRVVQSRGHWRVLIRPGEYEDRRLVTAMECWEAVRAAAVSLRGWPYPWVDSGERILGNDWGAGATQWKGHREVWKFFRSGQFVHYFAMAEDTTDGSGNATESAPPNRFVAWVSALYSVCEIVEFARRLALRPGLLPTASISIQLHRCKGRWISSYSPARSTCPTAACPADVVEANTSESGATLIENSVEVATTLCIDLFGQFQWVPEVSLIEQEVTAYLRTQGR